jgi:2-oxoglutarate dehydrogenase E1 component
MTPKSLLRHKLATSALADMGPGTTFHRVLPETGKLVAADKVRRVVLCTGKVYYDLFEEREKRGIDDVALLRVEQLYPFPFRTLEKELQRYRKAEVVWCQEEPYNMGAWSFVQPNIERVLDFIGAKHTRPRYVGRAASASTATGLMSRHLKELRTFLDEALGENKA